MCCALGKFFFFFQVPSVSEHWAEETRGRGIERMVVPSYPRSETLIWGGAPGRVTLKTSRFHPQAMVVGRKNLT